MLGQVSIAAATAVIGYDLARDTTWSQSSTPRILRGIALAGSAAAGDTKVEVFRGSVKVAEAYNSATGFPTRDHLFPVGAPIPPNEEVAVIVDDAPATNPINLIMEFQE
jgi:hypothetical protein